MRNTVKYVLAISSAAVLTAGTFLLVSAKPAGAKTLCSQSTCELVGHCIMQPGQNCAQNSSGCASVQCNG